MRKTSFWDFKTHPNWGLTKFKNQFFGSFQFISSLSTTSANLSLSYFVLFCVFFWILLQEIHHMTMFHLQVASRGTCDEESPFASGKQTYLKWTDLTRKRHACVPQMRRFRPQAASKRIQMKKYQSPTASKRTSQGKVSFASSKQTYSQAASKRTSKEEVPLASGKPTYFK